MKKSNIVIIVVAVILALGGMKGCSSYNSMVRGEQEVDASWAQVETQYQRRADLIPNLVSTVKGYASHESSTLEKVTEARAKASSINISGDNLDEEALSRFQKSQSELTGALKSLLAVAEAYPDLKANENFKDLQVQLEGTENRIAKARNEYTNAVKAYNVSIRTFPANIFANLFGFSAKPQFQAEEGASSAPKVEF